MVSGDGGRGAAEHSLLPRTPLRLLSNSEWGPALPNGFSRPAASTHSIRRRNYAGNKAGGASAGFGVRHYAKRRGSSHHTLCRKTEGRKSSRGSPDEPRVASVCRLERRRRTL